MTIFNYDFYMHDAMQSFMSHSGNQRYGQFLVNYLHQRHPDIVIPQEVDPFFDNSKVPDFLNYLATITL